MKADLHIHTTASDGRLTPRAVVEAAHKLGLTLIAITDHDTTAGINEAVLRGQQRGVTVIPGVEISTDFNGEEVHILGYRIAPDDRQFNQVLHRLRDSRRQRGKDMLVRLSKLGYPLTWEEIMAQVGESDSIGRPHFARALVDRGYLGSVPEAFDRLLKNGRPAWVERYKLTPQEAIDTIHNAGGLAFLAHPGMYKEGKDLALRLLDLGINGLEVYHPEHSVLQVEEFLGLARDSNAFVSGGSDCHGPGKGLACQIGRVTVDMKELLPWLPIG